MLVGIHGAGEPEKGGMAMASIGQNIASELIGKILLQITETCRAAHDVVVEKKSFRDFSSYINRIEPILLELWKRNVQGSSEPVKMALEGLAGELNNASKLIRSYTSGSWMYLFLRCRALPDEMKQITQGIERCLNSLRIANLDVSMEIKEKTLALCETMRNAEFKAEVAREALVAEIEREMRETQSDSQQVLQLIMQVAEAMNVPVDQCFLESEIESVRKRKEDLENEKQRAEACMLEQIQGFLCRSGMVSTDSSSSPVCQSVPLYFFCPLTHKIMEDPVELESGVTYERRAIEEWLESGRTACPVKKCELLSTRLIPNYNLREHIQEWKEKNAKFKIESAAAKLVAGGDDKDVEEALVELCGLCRDRSSSRQAVGEKGLIPTILRFVFDASSVQGKAMQCLCYLAKEDGNKEKIANAGGIEQTVKHLTEETEMKNLAVSLLLELSKAPQLCQLIGETQNSIPLLVAMLSGPHAEKAREILNNLSEVDVNVIEMAEVNFYEPLVFQLIQGSVRTKKFLANAMSKMDPLDCGKAVTADGGILPPLVQMIQENNPETMTASLSALENLSKTEENCVCILDAEVASHLFRIMFWGSLKVDLREQAAYILANLATASSRQKKIHSRLKSLASEENIKTMLESLSLARPSLKVHLLQILLGLASNSSMITGHMRNALGIPVLLTLICNPLLEVRLNVMKLLSCLAEDGGENELAENLKETHIKALVDGIIADNKEERVVTVGILCHLPKDVSRIRTVLQETGALDAIFRLISSGESRNGSTRTGGSLIENALGALLHFTSPSNLSVQKTAVELGVVPLLVGFLLAGSSLSKQRAATALGQISESAMSTGIVVRNKNNFLSHACSCWTSPDPEDICPVHRRICATDTPFCLVHAGAVEPLVQTLQERDSQADEAALNALSTLLHDNIWEAGLNEIVKAGGVEPIVELLKTGSPGAQEKATLVLQKIFQKAEYRDLYGSAARFSLIDIMQQGPISIRRAATGILHLLGDMPDDSGWLQSQ